MLRNSFFSVFNYALCACALFVSVVIHPSPIHAQGAASTTADAARSHTVLLSGTWQFALAANKRQADRLAPFHEVSFTPEGFKPIPVPSNWALHGFEEPLFTQWYTLEDQPVLPQPSEAEGFYLHRFRPPADARGKRALLHFDGVWQSAEVWLNGNHLGRHDSGFTGFAFDITGDLRFDADNILAVRVRQRTKTAMLDVNDDWALGGIYRDVYLEFMPAEGYIDRVEATTDFDDEYRDADLHVRLLIGRQAHSGPAHQSRHPYRARFTLTSKEGREVARTETTGAINLCGFVVCGQEARVQMRVRAPLHWTAETPNLYDLRVDLLLDNRVVHTWSERIGFREVSTAGGVLKVNGQPVKLRGVARHDEHPDVGRATRREHWLKDIQLMKAANINAVRTSHYPPAEGFIKLCDELGLYVIEEVPMGFGGDLLLDPSLAGTVLLRAQETIKRDRNRPSVIIWSIGNEDPLTDLHLAAVRYVKSVDPTRPVLMPWRAEETLPAEIDILAPHYKTAEEYDRLAAKSRRPVITTEYSHAVGDQDFGGLADRWESLTKHPAGAGGMIWVWADQGLRRMIRGRAVLDPLADFGKYKARGSELVRHSQAGPGEIYDSHGIFGTDGIVNADRTPQRDYWETRAVYAPVKVLVERVPLAVGQRSVRVPVRNEYDFTDLSAIQIRWQLMADERELAAGSAPVSAAPHSTTTLDVPVEALTRTESKTSRYIRLAFRRADDSEIVNRSVRLIDGINEATRDGVVNADQEQNAARRGHSRLQVTQNGSIVIVSVGDVRYEFDSRAAGLIAASRGGRQIVTGARATIWRPFTITELKLFRGGDEREGPPAPELDRYTTTVRSWRVVQGDDVVRIEAEAEHRINDKNSFTARYDYRLDRAGTLHLAYVIEPHIEINGLPEVGIEFRVDPQLNTLRWAGLGLLDAYPNKRAAAHFGVWKAHADTMESQGVKSDVEWAELTGAGGRGLRVAGSRYTRFERVAANGAQLRVLSAVAGRPTKFGGPERPEDHLTVSAGRSFKGSFSLSLLPGA